MIGGPRCTLRAGSRLICISLWTLLLLLPYLAVRSLRPAWMSPMARLWNHGLCVLAGLKLEIKGGPADSVAGNRPVLYVSNHSSYLDIPVLGSLLDANFVAKGEVAGWPILGYIAHLGRTVFVERRASRSADESRRIERRLRRGANLILFPEGTSNDGNRVLPFKSALFSAAEPRAGSPAPLVQPVSLAYTRLNGVPMGREWRPFLAWYGAMELAPHLWQMLKLGLTTVEVRFHAPVTLEALGDRKALARHCERVVAEGVADSLAGEGVELPAAAGWWEPELVPTQPLA